MSNPTDALRIFCDYLPYAFADSHLLDPGQIGDIQADSAITSFDVYSGSIPKWYETQYRLTSANDPETRQYLALEQSYRQYVTDRDLQMTQESWNTLYRQLGETCTPQSHRIAGMVYQH